MDISDTQLLDLKIKTDNLFNDIVITTNQIVYIIELCTSNKASGPDIISHKILKICPNKIAIPLSMIFNKSLRQCKYPSSWKIANVIALFEKGDISLPSNYRPISLVSCIGKVMEVVLYKHVFNHLLNINQVSSQYVQLFINY